MTHPKYDYRNDPFLRLAGTMISDWLVLAAIETMPDGYGAALFMWWYTGKAPREIVIDDPHWAAYMRADKRLPGEIDRQLLLFAGKVRDDPHLRSEVGYRPVSNRPYSLTFHAEVGSKSGGFKTGYEVLHGSNKTVGDFQIRGMYSMTVTSDSRLNFMFFRNVMTFNDIVDPNCRWSADVTFANLAKNLGRATGTPPRDYIVRIRWHEPGPLRYSIPIVPALRTYGGPW